MIGHAVIGSNDFYILICDLCLEEYSCHPPDRKILVRHAKADGWYQPKKSRGHICSKCLKYLHERYDKSCV